MEVYRLYSWENKRYNETVTFCKKKEIDGIKTLNAKLYIRTFRKCMDIMLDLQIGFVSLKLFLRSISLDLEQIVKKIYLFYENYSV